MARLSLKPRAPKHCFRLRISVRVHEMRLFFGMYAYQTLLTAPGITNAGVWAASCSYIAQSFEPQYRISTQGVLQGMNHGFGKGLGAIIGGAITTAFGTSLATDKKRSNSPYMYLHSCIWFILGTGNLFRAYGAASALILIGFLMINYFVKEKAASEAGKNDEGAGVVTGESSLAAVDRKSNLASGGTFDETAFMSPAGTPFIPASRTPAAVAAARNASGGAFNGRGLSK